MRPNLLHHRGPDALGIWQSPSSELPVLFVHSRLAILDLSTAGAQPMLSEDGNFILVFNGEIYNFLELRKELEDEGVTFRSSSDTEVLLNGLILYGAQFLTKCNGMWAFCFWNRREQTALIARDRYGEKPLYYLNHPNHGFAFASEMKALYPLLDSVTPIESYRYYCDNPFNYEASEHTIIRGISRLRPGFVGTWKNGRLTTSRWWNTLDNLEKVPDSYDEQVERWRELFLDAVRLRMRADVPIGTALSGGLDSTAVFCSMRYVSEYNSNLNERVSASWQHGFCAHYPNSSLDELHWASLAASHVSCELEPVLLTGEIDEEAVLGGLYQVEDPYLTSPIPMLNTYQAIRNKGIKVTLDGHGADELLSGYGEIDRLLPAVSLTDYRMLRKTLHGSRTGSLPKSSSYMNDFFSWLTLRLKHSPLKPIARKILFPNRPDLCKQDDFLSPLLTESHQHPAYQALDVFNKSLYDLTHLTVLPTLLRNYDRYSMANGVEIRMPFLDHRLVCFTLSLPWTSKVRNCYTKSVLRDSLVDIMPESIRLRRDKIGWNAPLHEWLVGPLRPMVERVVRAHETDNADLQTNWQLIKNQSNPSFEDGQRLWNRMLPFLWLDSLKLASR